MPHQIFSGVPDAYTAEVLSEVFVPGEYKNSFVPVDSFGPNDGFPPEPALLSSITARFIERDGRILRGIAMHEVSGPAAAASDEEVIDAYRSDVETRQVLAQEIEQYAKQIGLAENPYPQFGRLGGWAVEATRRSGHRLVAAHLVFKSPSTERTHHALSYPTAVKEEFPLILREFMGPLIHDAKNGGSDSIPAYDELPDVIKKYAPGVMQNTEKVSLMAGLPASIVLPPFAKFRMGLRMHRKQAQR